MLCQIYEDRSYLSSKGNSKERSLHVCEVCAEEEAVKKAEYPEMKKSNPLLEKVKKTIEKYQMFTIKARIVVGVSGGSDSTTLLHLLLQLRDEYKLKLWVAHLNLLILTIN